MSIEQDLKYSARQTATNLA